jgi:hypothetical protein
VSVPKRKSTSGLFLSVFLSPSALHVPLYGQNRKLQGIKTSAHKAKYTDVCVCFCLCVDMLDRNHTRYTVLAYLISQMYAQAPALGDGAPFP